MTHTKKSSNKECKNDTANRGMTAKGPISPPPHRTSSHSPLLPSKKELLNNKPQECIMLERTFRGKSYAQVALPKTSHLARPNQNNNNNRCSFSLTTLTAATKNVLPTSKPRQQSLNSTIVDLEWMTLQEDTRSARSRTTTTVSLSKTNVHFDRGTSVSSSDNDKRMKQQQQQTNLRQQQQQQQQIKESSNKLRMDVARNVSNASERSGTAAAAAMNAGITNDSSPLLKANNNKSVRFSVVEQIELIPNRSEMTPEEKEARWLSRQDLEDIRTNRRQRQQQLQKQQQQQQRRRSWRRRRKRQQRHTTAVNSVPSTTRMVGENSKKSVWLESSSAYA